ncbi:MAG: hypothetical protein SPJ69_03040 [Campylobacter sp.]|uniref:hypothetical protein n=1 Tax=Campylobacter sp. TaxID=205 RepID=UPI002976B398|nr:hypothetical protein [Campylobacter sp.]MDD6925245.1 hypothetical protein [Campylobacteraceae bacterium]MDD7600248.1 hypothetical protein [Campylobacteraceae bacterium]MDY5887274.1 hypothetical protein [Campylobacter sp.]
MQFNDFDINSPVIRHIHSLNEEIKALKDENYNLTIKLNKIKNFFPLKVALKIRKLLLKLIGRI